MRFSRYNLPVEVDKGLVIYNSQNAKYVNIFREPELSEIKNLLKMEKLPPDNELVKILYDNGYVVDDSVNEYEEVSKFIKQHYEKNLKTLRLTVYVTENCNFRCIYCPQKHEATTFSDEKWESLYKFFQNTYKLKKYEKVMISFFGGEPLLYSNKIIDFLEKIKNLNKNNKNISFYFQIVTNAYLLTPDLYDKLTSLGLLYYQITVDGFAETHNKMRPLANGKPSWDVIINNLKYINSKNDDTKIILRTNYNNINQDSLEEFYKWITSTFNNKKFLFDIARVSKFSDNVDDSVVGDIKYQAYNNSIIEKNNGKNPSAAQYLTKLGQTCSCAENYYIISANGNLSKCEQAYEDNISVGYLDDDGNFIFEDYVNDWLENYELEKCKECFIYPLCAGRSCITKKALYPVDRPDCSANNYDVIQNTIKLIRSGYLHKDHKCENTK